MEAAPPGGSPWPGEGRVRFAWFEGGPFLMQRWTVDMPEAPNGTAIIGCDAANGTYYQLYSDDRGVCRVYEMGLHGREWTLQRTGEPFAQRFVGTFSEDGRTIIGRWELAEDGETWRTDFDLTYTKLS
jgi:hypothetical protein